MTTLFNPYKLSTHAYWEWQIYVPVHSMDVAFDWASSMLCKYFRLIRSNLKCCKFILSPSHETNRLNLSGSHKSIRSEIGNTRKSFNIRTCKVIISMRNMCNRCEHTDASSFEFAFFALNIHLQYRQTIRMLISTSFRYRLLQFYGVDLCVETCQISMERWQLNTETRIFTQSWLNCCYYTYSSIMSVNCDEVKQTISPNCSNLSVNHANRSPIIFDLRAWPNLIFVRLFNL